MASTCLSKICGWIDRHVIYALTDSSVTPISIEEAAAIGDIDRIEHLVKQGVNVADFDSLSYMTPLHRAAMEGTSWGT